MPVRIKDGRRRILRERTAWSLVVSFVVLALVTAACGSTLPQAEQIAVLEGSEGSGVSSTLPPGAEINAEGEIVNAQGEVIGTVDEGLVTTSEGVASTGSGTTTTTSVDPGENGPGVTNDTIQLGLMHIQDTDVALEAVGASPVGSFDYKRGWEALIKYQNARGGIAGRRIIPVFHGMRLASSESWPQQQQEECARWTQDNHVFAGLAFLMGSDNLRECLQEAGAVMVSLDIIGWDASNSPDYQRNPYYVVPVGIGLDRRGAAMVDGLHGMDYFGQDQKLGLVTFDHPGFKYAVDNGMMPALRRHGISLTDAAYLHRATSLAEISETTRDANNAVLRFKTQGIDHVVFLDIGSTLASSFMQAAEKQDYHPRYGLSTGNQNVARLLGEDAGSQLHGALSIGWVPTFDVREEDDPSANDPTRVLCLAIMKKAGIDTASPNGKAGALTVCDSLWSLATALDGASMINQTTFLAGMNRLRGAYSPGATWSTYIGPTQHDGVSSVANLRFVDSCTCFKYSSRPYQI